MGYRVHLSLEILIRKRRGGGLALSCFMHTHWNKNSSNKIIKELDRKMKSFTMQNRFNLRKRTNSIHSNDNDKCIISADP